MPSFQYDRHEKHCVLESVSSNSNSSTLPTSWIIRFDSGLNGLFGWFCRRSCWRACRSGWLSIYWINSRTPVLCACFTTECANPGIRKSMLTSFSIVCYAFMKRTCLATIWHIYCDCFNNGLPRSIRRNSFFVKKFTSISWERDVFLPSCTVLMSAPTTDCTDLLLLTTGCPDLSRLGFGIGWFDWKLLDGCTTCPSGRWTSSQPSSLFRSCFNDLFGGGRGDMYAFSFKTSPVFNLTTFEIQYAVSVSWRMMAFGRVWWNFNPFFIARYMSAQYTASWCLFHALCMFCAWSSTLKSIVSTSLWFLSMGSTGRKNTLCLLLNFWSAGINPKLMMECKLIAHPMW